MARRSIPKASNLQSKFHQTINASVRFRAEGEDDEFYTGPMGEEQEGRRGGEQRRGGYSERERYNVNLQDAQRAAMRNPQRAARDLAYYQTWAQRGTPPAVAELEPTVARPRVRQADIDLVERADRERTWRTQSNIYRTPASQRRPPGGFLREEAAKSHREWVDKQMADPNSEFNRGLDLGRARTGRHTPGQRQRLSTYTDALQRGSSHDEAMEQVRRTRLSERVGRPAERVAATRRQQAQEAIGARARPSGRTTRLQSVTPSPQDFTFGIDAQKPPNLEELKRRFPTRPESELIQMQQAGTEFISSELLANQKWAHETRRSNLLGQRSGRTKEAPDRVTIFTTNVGHPAVSVPSDSLVGQYIIKKRKSILAGAGTPQRDLHGKFPDAVRDAHIIDVATGASLGVQGRSGVMNSTGYKFGKRTSPGYGRPRPLGSHILYDSAGRPLYDPQGNIRYSDGATRPIDWSTPNVGARILIG